MKYPFQKKSFWIILTGSLLIIFLFTPTIGLRPTPSSRFPLVEISDWTFLFKIQPHTVFRPIIIFEIVVAFLLNYLGHLIFSKPAKNQK